MFPRHGERPLVRQQHGQDPGPDGYRLPADAADHVQLQAGPGQQAEAGEGRDHLHDVPSQPRGQPLPGYGTSGRLQHRLVKVNVRFVPEKFGTD